MSEIDLLKKYKEKRLFDETPEPLGDLAEDSDARIFVVQKHDASNLHYDLRLEVEGVLKSWAVPKGPSMDPSIKRLAVPTEDHPMAYSDFEGVIPEGHYGAGIVLVWDRGTYHNLKDDDSSIIDNINDGHVTITLNGEKLVGGFALLRTGGGDKPRWLFFKMKDSYAKPGSAILDEQPNSVKTGRSLEEVADQESPADLHDFS